LHRRVQRPLLLPIAGYVVSRRDGSGFLKGWEGHSASGTPPMSCPETLRREKIRDAKALGPAAAPSPSKSAMIRLPGRDSLHALGLYDSQRPGAVQELQNRLRAVRLLGI